MTIKTSFGKWNILVAIVGFAFFFLGYSYINATQKKVDIISEVGISDLTEYKDIDLNKYNGDNPEELILIGLNGWVYDATPGFDFYNKQGPYHYLAGRDSSTELNLVGGDIIKKKYKIVGRLIQ